MVAEQRETVQRIDADTVDIASNVSGAQRELLKYYASISNNRWLMLKIFGVLIVFVRCFTIEAVSELIVDITCSSWFSFWSPNEGWSLYIYHIGLWTYSMA